MWKYLTHPNIVPLLGVVVEPLQLISCWVYDQDLVGHITNNPTADRLSLVSALHSLCTKHSLSPKLSDVVEGLNHLHSCNVIHGNLKGVCDYLGSCLSTLLTLTQSNVLVDAAGNARITGPGLAAITHDLDSIRNALDDCDNSARWIAPEILVNRGTYTKEADVYSFAMVTIEVCYSRPSRGRHLRLNYRSSEKRFSPVLSRFAINRLM